MVLACRGQDSTSPPNRFVRYLVQTIRSIQEEPFLFLAKTPDPSVINKALLYVRDNEQTSRVLVVRPHRPPLQKNSTAPCMAHHLPFVLSSSTPPFFCVPVGALL
jgi:hypothetical protein